MRRRALLSVAIRFPERCARWRVYGLATRDGWDRTVRSIDSQRGLLGSGDIRAQLIDAAGVKVGAELEVNTHTPDTQWRPSVAMDDDRNFVVVWQSFTYGIRSRRYASDGSAIGGEFQVSSELSIQAAVAMKRDGDFMVTWDGVGAQLFSSSVRESEASCSSVPSPR